MNALIEFLQEKKVVALADLQRYLHQKGASFGPGVDLFDIIFEMQRRGSVNIDLEDLQIFYQGN